MLKAVLVRVGILLSAFVGLSSTALAGKAGGGGSHTSTGSPNVQTRTQQQQNSVKGAGASSNTLKPILKKGSDTDSSIMQNMK
jgi:ABC-type phosphate transport system substrate-binding protein